MRSTAQIRKLFEGKNLFTVKEAAQYLGFAPNSLRIWDAKGVLVPSRTAGNQRRYSREQLDGFTRKKYERIVQRTEDGGQTTETRGQKTEDRSFRNPSSVFRLPSSEFSSFPSVLKRAALITVASLVVVGGVITFLTTTSSTSEKSPIAFATGQAWLRKNVPPVIANKVKQSLAFLGIASSSDNNRSSRNDDKSAVLAESTLSPSYLFRVRIPSQFDGVATFKDNIILGDKKLEARTINALELTAGNVIYSVKAGDGISVGSGQNPTITNSGVLSVGGKTGAVTLTAGTGITIDGNKITNSLPEANQSLWKTFTVGSTSLNAGSTTDTFTFAAGTGIALALDSTNKKLTVTGTADPGITDDGTVVRLSTSTDNVGFGTTSPLARLDVRGNSGITPAASVSAQSSFAALVLDNKGVGDIFTASSSGLNRFVITQNGNVGIGTVNPAFKLEVDGHIGPTSANGYDLGSTLLPFRYVYAQNLVSGSSGTVGLLQRAAGTIAPANITDDLVLGATATASATIKLTGTTNANSWFNLGTGNVGIGTTAPNYKLEVAGTFGATGNITLGDTTADTITFTGRVASVIEPSTGSQYDLGSSTRPWANVYADNITTSGNVSMSGTTQADFRINQDYAGADGESSTLTFERGSPAVNAALKWNASDVSPSYLFSLNAPLFINPDSGITMSGTSALIVNQIQSQGIFTASASGATKFIINKSGYVGIGTGSNNETLLSTFDVRSLLGTQPVASISGNTSMASLVVDNSGVGDIFTASSSGLNRFVITQNGNVGVGITTPDYLLELTDNNTTPTFALSDDDIAHGVTTVAQTDSFFHLSSISTTVGGAYLQGLADATGVALQLRGIQSSDPTDTTPAISLIGAKANGTGVQDLAATETVFQVANNDDTAAISVVGTGAVTLNTSLTITGTEGSTVSTITAGDAVISDGSLAITDDDDAASFSLTNNTATTIGAGINTAGLMDISSTSLTTGNLLNLETTTALSSGRMLNITSTSTALTSGNLLRLDWTPGSATTATGDLFTLNIGANGTTTGNLFNILDSSSSIFSVSETAVTTSLPTNFTSSGDVSVAYDLNMTNPTASYIKSQAPLYLESGEVFNSSDLTLKTYNQGSIVLSQNNTVASGATSYGVILDSQLIDNAVNPTTHYSLYNVPTSNITGDTLTTMYGDYIGLTNSAGTITTWYGQYIAAPTGSGTTSNKYALVTEDASGNVGFGDTTPDYLLELNDNTNSPAFGLSDDDVAHGVTTVANTDSFFHLSSISTTVGGAYLQGIADATGVALQLRGIQSSDPTDTTPAISLIGAKANGTGVQDLAATETVFQVANNDDTAAMTILGNGNVGIGTTGPGAKLEVVGLPGLTLSQNTLAQATAPTSISRANTYLRIGGAEWGTNSYRIIGFGYSETSRTHIPAYIGYKETNQGNYTYGDLIFGTRSVITDTQPSERMRIDSIGNIGIGTTAPLAALDVRGNSGTVPVASISANTSFATLIVDNTGSGDLITASTSGTIRFTVANNGNLTVVGSATTCTIGNGTGATNCTSDIRLKDNIVSLDSSTLDKIMMLNPVNFTWKNNPNLGTKTGLIAQEVQEVFPEFVNELPGGYLGLDYAGLVSPAIKAIQELSLESLTLQNQVASLSAALSISTSSLRASETSAAISDGIASSYNPRNDDNSQFESLSARLSTLETNLASFSAILGTSTSSASFTSVIASDPSVIASLSEAISLVSLDGIASSYNPRNDVAINSATVSGSLMVLGRTTLSDLGVTGTFTAGLLSINGMTDTGDAEINTLGGTLKLQTLAFDNIEMMAGKVTIDTSGNIVTTGSITTPQIVIDATATSSATLGSAVLSAFSAQTVINTTSITANSRIFLTPTTSTNGQSLFIKKKTNSTGFTVGIDSPFSRDIKFDWWVVEEK